MRKNSLTRGDVNNYLKALYQVGGAELYVDSIPSIENYQYSYPDATVDEAEEWARSMTDKYDKEAATAVYRTVSAGSVELVFKI